MSPSTPCAAESEAATFYRTYLEPEPAPHRHVAARVVVSRSWHQWARRPEYLEGGWDCRRICGRWVAVRIACPHQED